MTELEEAIGEILELFGFFEITFDDVGKFWLTQGSVAEGDLVFHGDGGKRRAKFVAGVGNKVRLLFSHFLDGLKSVTGKEIAGASTKC